MRNIATSAIRSVNWQPALGESGAVVEDLADINQAIAIILTTPKGSDPHRPEFGADLLQYIDRPEVEATPYLIAEAADAILAWEPRVDLVSITPAYGLAQVTLSIAWKFRNGSAPQTTEVTL